MHPPDVKLFDDSTFLKHSIELSKRATNDIGDSDSDSHTVGHTCEPHFQLAEGQVADGDEILADRDSKYVNSEAEIQWIYLFLFLFLEVNHTSGFLKLLWKEYPITVVIKRYVAV